MSYTSPTPELAVRAISDCLTSAVDCARDVATRLGVRQYAVRITRLRWSGGEIGSGVVSVADEFEILPAPRVVGVGDLDVGPASYGPTESGAVVVDRISLRYTAADLAGERNGPLEPGEEVVWEVALALPTGFVRRTFHLASTPERRPASVDWAATLTRAPADRGRGGELWT